MSVSGERGWVGPAMNKFQQVSSDHHQMLLAGDGYVSSDDHQMSLVGGEAWGWGLVCSEGGPVGWVCPEGGGAQGVAPTMGPIL